MMKLVFQWEKSKYKTENLSEHEWGASTRSTFPSTLKTGAGVGELGVEPLPAAHKAPVSIPQHPSHPKQSYLTFQPSYSCLFTQKNWIQKLNEICLASWSSYRIIHNFLRGSSLMRQYIQWNILQPSKWNFPSISHRLNLRHHAKRKKLVRRRQTLHNSTFMRVVKLMAALRSQSCACWRLDSGKGKIQF